MFNVGPVKLLEILAVALLVFGPDKLPDVAKQVGRAVREFRNFQAAMEANVRDVIEPITGPIIPNGPIPPPPTNGIATPSAAAESDGPPPSPAAEREPETRAPDPRPDPG